MNAAVQSRERIMGVERILYGIQMDYVKINLGTAWYFAE
jgi:hypothetical protein